MHFYTTKKVGVTRERTPEGFLLCRGAVLTRTGELLYTRGETPIDPGPDNIAHIQRTPSEVFRPETIASANGKPVCNEHPPQDVTPDNWKRLAVGVVLDCRRGKFPEDDLLLADLLITDKQAIRLIEDGKVELSCGYDADYEADDERPGYGHQLNIVINHVALVESGRCGPRCSIGDSAAILEDKYMRKPSTLKVLARRLKAAWAQDDAKEFEKALSHITGEKRESEPEDDSDTHIHLHLAKFKGEKNESGDSDRKRGSRHHDDDDDEDEEEEERHSRRHRDDDEPRGKRLRDSEERHSRRHRDDDEEEEGDMHAFERRMDKLEETVAGIAAELKKLVASEEDGSYHDDDEDEEEEERRASKHHDDDEGEEEDEEDGKRSRHHDDDEEEDLSELREGRGERGVKGATGEDSDGKRSKRHDSEEKRHHGRATDSASIELAALDLEWRETRSLAEILAPGMRLPTHDASNPKRTTAAMCRVRRQALDSAYRGSSQDREMIEAVVGGPLRLDGMTCDAVAVAFRGAAQARRMANHRRPSRNETVGGGGTGVSGSVRTPADFNRMMHSRWSDRYKTQH